MDKSRAKGFPIFNLLCDFSSLFLAIVSCGGELAEEEENFSLDEFSFFFLSPSLSALSAFFHDELSIFAIWFFPFFNCSFI